MGVGVSVGREGGISLPIFFHLFLVGGWEGGGGVYIN